MHWRTWCVVQYHMFHFSDLQKVWCTYLHFTCCTSNFRTYSITLHFTCCTCSQRALHAALPYYQYFIQTQIYLTQYLVYMLKKLQLLCNEDELFQHCTSVHTILPVLAVHDPNCKHCAMSTTFFCTYVSRTVPDTVLAVHALDVLCAGPVVWDEGAGGTGEVSQAICRCPEQRIMPETPA